MFSKVRENVELNGKQKVHKGNYHEVSLPTHWDGYNFLKMEQNKYWREYGEART